MMETVDTPKSTEKYCCVVYRCEFQICILGNKYVHEVNKLEQSVNKLIKLNIPGLKFNTSDAHFVSMNHSPITFLDKSKT